MSVARRRPRGRICDALRDDSGVNGRDPRDRTVVRLMRAGSLAAAVVLAVTGCTSAPVPPPTASGASAEDAPTQDAPTQDAPAQIGPAGDLPAGDVAAIRSTIDALNAGAGDGPAAQQQVLTELADPGRRSELDDCRPATRTVWFEPVYRGLRIADEPMVAGADPDPDGVTYALPTLIRVATGDRRTATDLTTLLITVRPAPEPTEATGSPGGTGPEVYLTPFCLN